MRSSYRSARLLAAALVSCVAAVLVACLPVRADVYWTLPAGQAGDWSVASNWGGTIPTGSVTAYIVEGGTANITLPGEACNSLSLGGTGSGAIQMTAGGQLTAGIGYGTNGSEYVGYSAAGSFTQSGGTNTINVYTFATGLCLGYNPGSSGTYLLSGTGQLQTLGSAYGAFEIVGNSGSGAFTQTGGINTVSDYNGGNLFLGDNPGSSGTYILSGAGRLSALGQDQGGAEYVGYSGTGSFTQSGGTNTVSSNVSLGNNAGSSGTYDLHGNGRLFSQTEYLGNSGTGSFAQSGGTNTISSGLYLGNNAGSSGTYSLSGGRAVRRR